MIKNTREKLGANPRRSATKLAAEAGISQTSMRRILKKDFKIFPYKMQKHHKLTPTHERIALTLFIEAYDCFSVYSHRNNV